MTLDVAMGGGGYLLLWVVLYSRVLAHRCHVADKCL